MGGGNLTCTRIVTCRGGRRVHGLHDLSMVRLHNFFLSTIHAKRIVSRYIPALPSFKRCYSRLPKRTFRSKSIFLRSKSMKIDENRWFPRILDIFMKNMKNWVSRGSYVVRIEELSEKSGIGSFSFWNSLSGYNFFRPTPRWQRDMILANLRKSIFHRVAYGKSIFWNSRWSHLVAIE